MLAVVPCQSRRCRAASNLMNTAARNRIRPDTQNTFASQHGYANDELIKMSQNPKDWVMPTGNYANQRYSPLKQITADNVGKLQVAWTFSTGVLRGHEGGPLVIGDMMYVHTPFPNIVYRARPEEREQDRLEVRAEAGSERHSGHVLRHGQSRRRLCGRQDLPAPGRHDARRARCQDRQGRLVGEERRSRQGRDRHLGAA